VRTMAYEPVPGEQSFQLPLFRIISLLAASNSQQAANAFVEYLREAEPRFRLDMARSLGCLAEENCIEPVNRIFAGEENALKGMTMVGIGQALAAGGAPIMSINAALPCRDSGSIGMTVQIGLGPRSSRRILLAHDGIP
jgi:hypothetical protein